MGPGCPALMCRTAPAPRWAGGWGQHLAELPHGQQQPSACPTGATASASQTCISSSFLLGSTIPFWPGQGPPCLCRCQSRSHERPQSLMSSRPQCIHPLSTQRHCEPQSRSHGHALLVHAGDLPQETASPQHPGET